MPQPAFSDIYKKFQIIGIYPKNISQLRGLLLLCFTASSSCISFKVVLHASTLHLFHSFIKLHIFQSLVLHARASHLFHNFIKMHIFQNPIFHARTSSLLHIFIRVPIFHSLVFHAETSPLLHSFINLYIFQSFILHVRTSSLLHNFIKLTFTPSCLLELRLYVTTSPRLYNITLSNLVTFRRQCDFTHSIVILHSLSLLFYEASVSVD